MRRGIKFAVIVVATVALAATGVALAFDDGSEEEPLGSAADRIAALLEPLVDAGTIDEDQAAAVGERLADVMPIHPPERPPGEHAREGAERRLGRSEYGRIAAGTDLADFLGMSFDELREALGGGSSLSAIAGERGIGSGDLVEYLLEPVIERLDDAVAADRITEAERDELLAQAEERIADSVERERPVMEPGDRDCRRFGPGHGFHHSRPGGADAPEGTDSST